MRDSIVSHHTLVAGALLILAAAPVSAQVSCTATGAIEGVVRTEAGVPIARAELVVSGVAPATSDTDGRYRLSGVCAGTVTLQARRIGFVAASLPVSVERGAMTALDVTLAAAPLALEPVVVRAQGGSATARRLREFYLRRRRGSGAFITREDLVPYAGQPVTEPLRARVAGVQIFRGTGAIRNHVRLRGQRCAPMVWIDGMSTPAGEFDLDVIESGSIAGIEVYSGPATIPAQFRTPFGRDGCGGAIVLWTRVGMDEWDVAEEDLPPEPPAHGPPLVVYEASGVDVPAAVDSTAFMTPFYPDSLRAFEVGGTVEVSFVVDTSGRPLDASVKVVRTSSREFGDAVVRAIRYSRFIPARKDGVPVRQRMSLTFEFTTRPKP